MMDTEPRRLAAGAGRSADAGVPGRKQWEAPASCRRARRGRSHAVCALGRCPRPWAGRQPSWVHTQGCCPPSTWDHRGSRACLPSSVSGPGPHPELEGANGHPLPQRWRQGLLRAGEACTPVGHPSPQRWRRGLLRAGEACTPRGNTATAWAPASVSLTRREGGKWGGHTRYPSHGPPSLAHIAPDDEAAPRDRGADPTQRPLSPWHVPENSPRASTPRRGHTDPPPASPARSLPRPGPCPPVSAALTPTLALARGPERAGRGGPAARGSRPTGQDARSLRGPSTQRPSAPASASHVQPPSAMLWPAPATPPGEPGPAGRGAPRPSQDPWPQPP